MPPQVLGAARRKLKPFRGTIIFNESRERQLGLNFDRESFLVLYRRQGIGEGSTQLEGKIGDLVLHLRRSIVNFDIERKLLGQSAVGEFTLYFKHPKICNRCSRLDNEVAQKAVESDERWHLKVYYSCWIVFQVNDCWEKKNEFLSKL